MKTIIYCALTLLLLSCESQGQQVKASDTTATNLKPSIELLEENTMILYNQDSYFQYYKANPSVVEKGIITGLYKVFQVCEKFEDNIKNKDEVESNKKELMKFVESQMASIVAMAQKQKKKQIYSTYQVILNKLKEMDFSPENAEQSLLNLALVENMLVQNMVQDKNFIPYKFNKFEPFAFADSYTVQLNDSIPLHVSVIAYDSTEAQHVKYATNPQDLHNNKNITEIKGGNVYLKGKEKGEHTLYGLIKVKTRKDEERWLPWKYNYVVE